MRGRAEHVEVGHPVQVTQDAHERGLARREVQVRRVDLLDPFEHPVQLGIDAGADEVLIGLCIRRSVRGLDRREELLAFGTGGGDREAGLRVDRGADLAEGRMVGGIGERDHDRIAAHLHTDRRELAGERLGHRTGRHRLHDGLVEVDELHPERDAQRGREILRAYEPALQQDRRQREARPRRFVHGVFEHVGREDMALHERLSELSGLAVQHRGLAPLDPDGCTERSSARFEPGPTPIRPGDPGPRGRGRGRALSRPGLRGARRRSGRR